MMCLRDSSRGLNSFILLFLFWKPGKIWEGRCNGKRREWTGLGVPSPPETLALTWDHPLGSGLATLDPFVTCM